MLKAGVAMAIGMTLMIPTFNAINNSYISVTEVPPWMPQPDQLPEDFVPPDEIPEGWQPPPDWKPPEGWEDWKPPEDWEGKFDGIPPPAGSCPPPIVVMPDNLNDNITLSGNSFSDELQFEVPEYTVGVAVWANWTAWVAGEIRGDVASPNGDAYGEEIQETSEGDGGPVELSTPVQDRVDMEWIWDPRQRANELPAPGTYTLSLAADPPGRPTDQNGISGRIRLETYLVLPCGGAFQ